MSSIDSDKMGLNSMSSNRNRNKNITIIEIEGKTTEFFHFSV